jgi:hypothetical protein
LLIYVRMDGGMTAAARVMLDEVRVERVVEP